MIKNYLKDLQSKKNYVWFLRQAGRYLPEYRLLRKTEKDFLTFCNNIKKASEVTLQPIRRFDLDSAIIFSDILIIPYLLGQKVKFIEKSGPVLEYLDNKSIDKMSKTKNDIEKRINTYKIIKKVRTTLDTNKGLIGFCGAPWTIACYMIDGSSKNNFSRSQNWIKSNKSYLMELLEIITDMCIKHLKDQGKAGCDSLMIFDSWASLVPDNYFEEIIISPTKKIINSIDNCYTKITYPKGIGKKIIYFNKYIDSEILSIDHNVDLNWLLKNIPSDTVLQGNLSPIILKEGGKKLVYETENILSLTSSRKHIFNVGHGIIKDTPIENIQKVLNIVRRI